MRIFNENKTRELLSYDKNLGYLKSDKLFIKHHEEQPYIADKGHYETIKEYENGGKDVKFIIYEKGQEYNAAYDEYEDIYVFVPYTEIELMQNKIIELKSLLAETDYKAIKYAEGELTEEEYAEMKEQRKQWRIQINELETQINN